MQSMMRASRSLRPIASPLFRSSAPSAPLAAAAQRLSFSRNQSAMPKEEVSEAAPEKEMLMFEGGKNKMVKTLKMASIANLGFAVSSGPVLYYITSATGQGGKGAMMSVLLVSFGGITTAACAWATGSYVLNIYSIVGKPNMMKIETPTLLGGSMFTEVDWSTVGRPVGYHPFATFEAAGSKYYIDELGDMHDESLIGKLEEKINA
jgi:hypothetical protein